MQKVSRKLRLSKTKNTKFNDSGTLLPFYFFFAAWGADIVVKVKCFYSVAGKIYGRFREVSNMLYFYFARKEKTFE